MRPCKSINCFFDAEFKSDVTEQIRRTSDGGFMHLDMNFWDWSHDPRSPFMQDGWREWVGTIAEAAAKCGVVFTQAHAHVYDFYVHPRDSVHERQVLRSIEGAGMLGIPWIVMHLSGRPGCFLTEVGREEFFRDNIAYIREKCEYAAEFGVGIAIENMSDASKNAATAADLVRIIDAVALPNAGACWDTGHANLAKQDQAGSIRTLGPRLHALHIADNRGEKDDHTVPYIGNIDWLPLVKALGETGYTGDLTFEAHSLVRSLPEPCKNAGLQLMYRIGEYLCGAAV